MITSVISRILFYGITDYTGKINLIYRPWGLKNKEIEEIIRRESDNPLVKRWKIGLLVKRISIWCLIAVPFAIIIETIFQVLHKNNVGYKPSSFFVQLLLSVFSDKIRVKD